MEVVQSVGACVRPLFVATVVGRSGLRGGAFVFARNRRAMVCRILLAVSCVASASQRSPSSKSIDIRMESAIGSAFGKAFLRNGLVGRSASMLSVESRGADAGSDALGLLQDLAPSASASGSISNGSCECDESTWSVPWPNTEACHSCDR